MSEPLCEVCRDTGIAPNDRGALCPENCWIARLRERERERLEAIKYLGTRLDAHHRV